MARLTSIHQWHVAHGAEFEIVGQWLRPWYYPKDGEFRTLRVSEELLAELSRHIKRLGLGRPGDGATVVVREHDHRHAGELGVEDPFA